MPVVADARTEGDALTRRLSPVYRKSRLHEPRGGKVTRMRGGPGRLTALIVSVAVAALVGVSSAIAAPPLVTTGNAAVGEAGATLQGIVRPSAASATDCHFEYGPSPALGAIAPCIPSSTFPVEVYAEAGGLQLGVTYYFRLVASNADGTSQGEEHVFQTVRPFTRPPRGGGSASPDDAGLYVAFCPPQSGSASLRALAAGTSEAGWPEKECLKMDKGPAGKKHKLIGDRGVHNWLLGGYGNDTIIGGDIGDVIWADYHPSGQPRWQSATIHAGNGRNVIYANDTINHVWTGTNPRTVVHAHVSGISGDIHCESPGIVVFLSTVSERHFKRYGCRHISHYSVGY